MAIALPTMSQKPFSTSRLRFGPISSPPSCQKTSSTEMLYKPGRLMAAACLPWMIQLQTAMPMGPSSWTLLLSQNCSSSSVPTGSPSLALRENPLEFVHERRRFALHEPVSNPDQMPQNLLVLQVRAGRDALERRVMHWVQAEVDVDGFLRVF
jgi:hypothetical protein